MISELSKIFGFPDKERTKSYWINPIDSTGLQDSKEVYLIYYHGRVLAILSERLNIEVTTAYALSEVFEQPPPFLFCSEEDHGITAYEFNNNSYAPCHAIPPWDKLVRHSGSSISRTHAVRIVERIGRELTSWSEDPRNRRVLGFLPRIFASEVAVFYELLQNAADAGARKIRFELNNKVLSCFHDGYPFTEIDVQAISDINFSTKTSDKIGFMGIGFKSVFDVCQKPEINSPPFAFYFDSSKPGGILIPRPLEQSEEISHEFTTLIRLELLENKVETLTRDLDEFDGKVLLYLRGDLTEIQTPKRSFKIDNPRDERFCRIGEYNSSGKLVSTKRLLVLHHPFKPSDDAIQEFAHLREQDPKDLRALEQEITAAVPLDESGQPIVGYLGTLQVYLPTSIQLPFAFDLQGNFLIDASRQNLKNPRGKWNTEYFYNAGIAIARLFKYVADEASAGRLNDWVKFYDVFPDWSKISESDNLHLCSDAGDKEQRRQSAENGFDADIYEFQVAPVQDGEGLIRFKRFGESILVDPLLTELLSSVEIYSITGKLPVSSKLSAEARSRLEPYCETFTVENLIEYLQKEDWDLNIVAFKDDKETKIARRWLSRLYSTIELWKRNNMWDAQKASFQDLKIYLTRNGSLRKIVATPEFRILPLEGTSFDTSELEKKYELMHPTLIRDLKKRDDVENEAERDMLASANKFVEGLVPQLDAATIIHELVEPVFESENWKQYSDKDLYRYTIFVRDNFGKLNSTPSIKLRVRSDERQYLRPSELYLGKEFGVVTLQDFLGLDGATKYVSPFYIEPVQSTDISSELSLWTSFFRKLGVSQLPKVMGSMKDYSSWNRSKLIEALNGQNVPEQSLRVTSLPDFPGETYRLLDWHFDAATKEAITKLVSRKSADWRGRLKAFARLIDENWDAIYSKYAYKKYQYVLRGLNEIEEKQTTALSSLGKFLKETPWLPVYNRDFTELPSKITALSEESILLAETGALFSDHMFESAGFRDFLGVELTPSGVSSMTQLEILVKERSTNAKQFIELYRTIEEQVTTDSLNLSEIQSEFSSKNLIYAPTLPEQYVNSGRVVFQCSKFIAEYFASLEELYPTLKSFFVRYLQIPETESIEHIFRYLIEYVWKNKPAISDEMRTRLISCYTSILAYTSNEENIARLSQNPLWEQFKEELTLFCGSKSWVTRKDGFAMLYDDNPRYSEVLSSEPDAAIDSHLKRMKKNVMALKPLLVELSIPTCSEFVREDISWISLEVHPLSHILGDNLQLLLSCLQSYLKKEAEDAEPYPKQRINRVLEFWSESKNQWQNITFYVAENLNASIHRKDTGKLVSSGKTNTYIQSHNNSFSFYISSPDILDLHEDLLKNLSFELRLHELPENAQEECYQVLSSNVPRINKENFVLLLESYLEKKSLPPIAPSENFEAVANLNDKVNQSIQEAMKNADGGPTAQRSPRDNVSEGNEPNDRSEEPEPPGQDIESIISQWPEFSLEGTKYEIVSSDESILDAPTSTKGQRKAGSRKRGRDPKSDEKLNDAYGRRGEEWVFFNEKMKLVKAGRQDLADRVYHISKDNPTNPWDIESFEKSDPFRPIRIEVKSTPEDESFTFPISTAQIIVGAQSDNFYIYRIMKVTSAQPPIYVYRFRDEWMKNNCRIQAKDVYLTLPRKKQHE